MNKKQRLNFSFLSSRYILTTWLIIVAVFIFWKGILPGWHNSKGDFNNYYVAAKLVTQGKNIHEFYNTDTFNIEAYKLGIENGAKFSPFPPLTAYAYLPLTIFEPQNARRVWLIFNLFILFIFPFRLREITNWSFAGCMLFLTLFMMPISSCLSFGQIYLLIAFVLTEVISRSVNGKHYNIAGLIIGVLASIKYLPILFTGYLFAHKEYFRVVLYVALGVLLPSLALFVLDPKAYYTFFTHFTSHLDGNLPGQGQYAVEFQSIDALLNNLFVYDETQNPQPYLNLPILKPLLKLSVLLLIVSILLHLYIKKRRSVKLRSFVSLGIVGAYVLLPASASYHFLVLVFPLLVICQDLKTASGKLLYIVAILTFITFTLQYHHIPTLSGYTTLNLLTHFPRLWGILCLFLVLKSYYKKV